jgi:hypothetical protein
MKDLLRSSDIFKNRSRSVEKVGVNGYVFEAFVYERNQAKEGEK